MLAHSAENRTNSSVILSSLHRWLRH